MTKVRALLSVALLLCSAFLLTAASDGLPGGIFPAQVTAVGGKATNGKLIPLSLDNTGSINVTATVSIATSTLAKSTAAETSRVIVNAAAQLMNVGIYNGSASAQYYQIFNSTTVPANGTAPTIPPIKVSPDTTVFVDFGPTGINFTTGISISNSSTALTKTIGSADSFYSASYH